MGIVHPGAPRDYVLALRDAFDIRCFVETGTYHGETAVWAAAQFDRVYTIELSEELYARSGALLDGMPNVTRLLGDTRTHLARLAPDLPPSIVWLDAHWSGTGTAGAGDECPLLDELAALRPALASLYVLIDDARMFLGPPHPLHDPTQWPTMEVITRALAHDGDRYVGSFEDIIVSVPLAAREVTARYVHREREAQPPLLSDQTPAPPRRARWLERLFGR